MRRVRVIPTLLLKGGGLVKTQRFRRPVYVGDPINAVKIFNEKQVDELAVLDIDATRERREPDLRRIQDLAGECFMPLAYGGGITSLEQIRRILHAGVEKVVLNSAVHANPTLVVEAARQFGSQSIVVSIDARQKWWGTYRSFTHNGTRNTGMTPALAARRAAEAGAGEILLTSIDREGTYKGFDLPLIRSVASAVTIPLVACGGARSVDDLVSAVREGGASAVAAGSLFVFQGSHRAVLISFPDEQLLREKFNDLERGYAPAPVGT